MNAMQKTAVITLLQAALRFHRINSAMELIGARITKDKPDCFAVAMGLIGEQAAKNYVQLADYFTHLANSTKPQANNCDDDAKVRDFLAWAEKNFGINLTAIDK